MGSECTKVYRAPENNFADTKLKQQLERDYHESGLHDVMRKQRSNNKDKINEVEARREACFRCI